MFWQTAKEMPHTLTRITSSHFLEHTQCWEDPAFFILMLMIWEQQTTHSPQRREMQEAELLAELLEPACHEI